jgi:hypothetical protein
MGDEQSGRNQFQPINIYSPKFSTKTLKKGSGWSGQILLERKYMHYQPNVIIYCSPINVCNNSGLIFFQIYLSLPLYIWTTPNICYVNSSKTKPEHKKNCCNIHMEQCRKRLQALVLLVLVCFAVDAQCKWSTRYRFSSPACFSSRHIWLAYSYHTG